MSGKVWDLHYPYPKETDGTVMLFADPPSGKAWNALAENPSDHERTSQNCRARRSRKCVERRSGGNHLPESQCPYQRRELLGGLPCFAYGREEGHEGGSRLLV